MAVSVGVPVDVSVDVDKRVGLVRTSFGPIAGCDLLQPEDDSNRGMIHISP